MLMGLRLQCGQSGRWAKRARPSRWRGRTRSAYMAAITEPAKAAAAMLHVDADQASTVVTHGQSEAAAEGTHPVLCRGEGSLHGQVASDRTKLQNKVCDLCVEVSKVLSGVPGS